MNQYTEPFNFDPNLYRIIFESAGDAIIICSEEGIAVECNQATLDLFACTREQLIGSSPIDWSPEFQPNGRSSVEMAGEVFTEAKSMGIVRFEWENKRSDGLPLVVDVTVRFKCDEEKGFFIIISRDITEHKDAIDALKKSEIILKTILDSSIDGVAVADAETLRLSFFNQAFCKMLGYTHEELENLAMAELHDAADMPRVETEIKRLKQRGGGLLVELPFMRKDGSKFLTDDSSSFLELDDKLHIMGVFRDITARQCQENKINRLNQIYAALVKTNRIARCAETEAALFQIICHIAVEDGGLQMAWIGVNQPGSDRIEPVASYGEHLNYLDDIVISVDPNILEGRGPTGTAFREAHVVVLQDLQATAETLPWRERMHSSGNWRTSAAFPIFRNGRPYAVLSLYHSERDAFDEHIVSLLGDMSADIGFALDVFDKENARQTAIHERKQKERLLRESAEEIEQFYNSAPCGFHSLNKDGIICRINNTELAWIGYTRNEVIGKMSWTDLLTPAGIEVFQQTFPILMKQGFIHEIECEIVRKNGTTFNGLINATAIYSSSGDYLMSRSTLLDVTRRKQAEAKLNERLNELAHVTRLGLMGEMASGIAHEVNQPLAAISSYTQVSLNMINNENPDLVKLTEILYKTQQQALRAGHIIHRMRGFLKSHAKHRSIADVNTLIHEAVGLCIAELKQNGDITLTFKLENNLPPVYVDHVQIEQVIINLIRNSIDALQNLPAKQQRQLTIYSRLTLDDGIEVRVKDNGPGLNEDQQQKIAMPFYTSKANGMGMGLSISRSLIEAHKGTLRFNSIVGKGATFYFTLPIEKRESDVQTRLASRVQK